MPWFAGYCGVMVNVSDIYAMGGRPLAVVDALWSAGAETARPLLEGLAEASRRYGVPIVGGHSNHKSARASSRWRSSGVRASCSPALPHDPAMRC
jgi:selenophosphate synthetase-related protein